MSSALAMLPRKQETATTGPSKSLRVNAPNDRFEREAEQVADAVTAGIHLAPWKLSSVRAGEIDRSPVEEEAVPGTGGESQTDSKDFSAIADVLLNTDAGRSIAAYVAGRPIVARDLIETSNGAVVVGSSALLAIAEIAKAHKSLPAQMPTISLDSVHPGLSLRIEAQGPLSRPTQGVLHLAFSGAKPAQTHKQQRDKSGEDTPAEHAGSGWGISGGPQSDAKCAESVSQPSSGRPGVATNALGTSGSTKATSARAHGIPHSLPTPKMLPPAVIRTRRSWVEHEDERDRDSITVQREPDGVAPSRGRAEASEIESVLHAPGHALDSETRQLMESRIGFDFRRVRVHTDARAADSARSIGARAYSVGNHIVFSRGRYSPRSTEGRRLLAHELAHVVQQSSECIQARSATAAPAVALGRASRQVQRSPEEDAKSLSISDLRNPIEALKKVARRIPGYELFTVIIGHDPISGTEVERNGTNLVGGFLKLIGKQDTFDNLQKSGALDRAFDWLKNEINQLGFSIDYFKGLINDAINSVHPGDVFDIPAALSRVYEIFKPPLIKAKEFASHVLNKVFEFIVQGVLDSVGATGVFDMLRKAGAAFSTIIKDPVGFLGHLVDALKQGFNQFKDNIVEHLKNAVLDWLFGEIATTGIKIPKPFNFAAIINLLLQILGLTYSKLRARLVKALGGEQPVVFLETSFDLLKTIATKGLSAAWQKILEMADNLIETVLSAVKDWAITKIVTAAVTSLIKLFNPAGAIIQAIQFIYEALRVFIEKANQIAALISAIADSLSEIAAGNIVKAASFIETTMAKTLPIILNFLAGLVGLGGIGQKIRDIIHGIQDKVGAAVDKVLNFIIEKGKALWEAGKGAVASVVEWWKARKEFKLGEEQHTLYIEGDDGEHPQIMVQSSPSTLEIFLDNVGASDAEKTNILALAKKVRWRKGEVQDSKKDADDGQARFDELYDAISALKVKGVTMPESEIANDPERPYGAGSGVTAYLSLKHRKGTAPNKRNDPEAWTDLGGLREKRSYVRGHLLNDRLGGLGEWENMMPLTNTSNGEFYRVMEEPVIDAVSTGKQLVWVRVEAIYKTGVKIPKNGTKDDKETAAESRLKSLKWSYGPAAYNGGWKKIPKSEAKGKGNQIEAKSGETAATK